MDKALVKIAPWIFAAVIAGLLTLIVMGALQSDEVRRKCFMLGGIPISSYCVKPNSFIEVN